MRPHRNLIVWQEGIQLVKLVYKFSMLLPPEEKFGIQSQIRRASVSVSVNIAEGAARKTEKEYLQFLYISRGSLSEIDTLIEIIKELEFITPEQMNDAFEKNNNVSAMLNGLINKIEKDICPA